MECADLDLPRFLEHLRARAGALRREVGAAMRQAEGHGHGLANHYHETDDDAVADLETSLDVGSLVRDVRELRAVDAALARMRDGTFGDCVQCGEAIAPARLLAQPEAARCIECESRRERTVIRLV